MPLSQRFRNAIEAPFTDEVFLAFVTITHPNLAEPIRVVDDVKDFMLGGERFFGFPFYFDLPSDTEQAPRGKLTIQNVDRIIGEKIRAIITPAMLTVQLYSSVDFDLTVSPRTPIGTPSLEYEARHLRIANASVDAMQITADILSWDLSQEPWPAVRATKGMLPALFR